MTFVDVLTEDNLKRWIKSNEFQMYLQPQYSISKNCIVGAEALVRWKHKDTFVSPAEFIPVFEKRNLVHRIDKFIWETAFRYQAERQKKDLELVPISINMSRKDFKYVDVYKLLVELSEKYGVSSDYIHIEITESAFVDDKETIFSSVKALKQYGFKILIDDFGSGYSALNILKDIEADVVKLDMKFFDLNTENSTRAREIIGAVIKMTQQLGMDIIAEGVENSEQLDILKKFGCDAVQGYFFYRPMCVSDFDLLMLRLMDSISRKKANDRSFERECYEESRKMLEKGEYENALTLVKRALEQSGIESDVKLYCDILNITGIIYSAIGNEMMAVEHYLMGLSVSLKNNYSVASGKFYNNIGSEYQKLCDHQNAVRYFKLSLAELEKDESVRQDNYANRAFIINMNLCTEYYELDEYEKAEVYLNNARLYVDDSSNEGKRLSFLVQECKLYIHTGKEELVQSRFPELMELALNIKDRTDFWSDMEELCKLALALKRLDEMKQIIDFMETQLSMFSDDQMGMNTKVTVCELLISYYKCIGDEELIRAAELEYIKLCRQQFQEVRKAKASAINYKIQLNTQYEENILFRKQIDIDQLTGVGNRYKLEKDYKMLKEICRESGCHVGIGIIDVDCFKEVNDTYGHLVGDNYLKAVSEIIKKTVISIGGVYRYGGDEFVVLLVDVDKEIIKKIAQKIETLIEMKALENQASFKGVLTVSQGYISINPCRDSDIWQVLPYADQQLYIVKNNGKQGFRIA